MIRLLDPWCGCRRDRLLVLLPTLGGRTTSRTAWEFTELMVNTLTFLCLGAILVIKMWPPDVTFDDVSLLLASLAGNICLL